MAARKRRRKSSRRWIQGAVKKSKRGALHRQLGVPVGETIPVAKLRKAAKAKGKLGQRARFALTMRRIASRRKRKRRQT